MKENRRNFLKKTGLAAAGLPLVLGGSFSSRAAGFEPVGMPLNGKTVTALRAHNIEGKVRLRWAKANRYYRALNEYFEENKDKEFEHVEIYRVAEKGILYSYDYAEYFMNYKGLYRAKKIFEGKIESRFEREFEYFDESVETGKVYSYFIKTVSGEPVGPVPVKVRHPDIWWSYTKINARLKAIAEKHPKIAQLSVCGKTVQGREIPLLRLGKGKKRIALVGAVHAGESGPELIVPAIEELLKSSPGIFQKVSFLAVPSVNIDVREQLVEGVPWYLRKNFAGIDLNRNFPADWQVESTSYGKSSTHPESDTFRGFEPASQPETKALIGLFEEFPPDLLFSFHWMGSISALPMNFPIGIYNWDEWEKRDAKYEEKCRQVAMAYGKAFYNTPQGEDWYPRPSISPGTLPQYMRIKYKIPAFDMEEYRKNDGEAGNLDQVTPEIMQKYRRGHTRALRQMAEMLL